MAYAKRFPTLFAAGVFVAMAVGLAGAKAISAYRYEARQFSAAMHDVSRPSDMSSSSFEDVALQVDGLTIRGWYAPPQNGVAIVFVHGSPADRRELLPEARALIRAGYGALLIDMPGHGESDGAATWGVPSQRALTKALDYLTSQAGVEHVGAYGFSMGSSVVAHVAAHDQRIGAVAIGGAFTTIEDQMSYEFGDWFKPWHAVTVLPAFWAARRSGLAMSALNTLEVVHAISPRPLLIIGGTDDAAVPYRMPRQLYAAAGEPKTLVTVKGAGHGHYEGTIGEAYYASILSFFDKSLLGDARAALRTGPDI